MIEKIDLTAAQLANHKIIRAIRRGCILIMPLTLVGSIAIVILNFPIPAFQE